MGQPLPATGEAGVARLMRYARRETPIVKFCKYA